MHPTSTKGMSDYVLIFRTVILLPVLMLLSMCARKRPQELGTSQERLIELARPAPLRSQKPERRMESRGPMRSMNSWSELPERLVGKMPTLKTKAFQSLKREKMIACIMRYTQLPQNNVSLSRAFSSLASSLSSGSSFSMISTIPSSTLGMPLLVPGKSANQRSTAVRFLRYAYRLSSSSTFLAA